MFDVSLALQGCSASSGSCRFDHKKSAAQKQRVKQGWIAWTK